MGIKGTQTEKNIMAAFAGESQARNRYTYFASKAKKEGLIQISDIFTETAEQEKEHAKRLFKLLEGGEVEITGAFPAGGIGATAENLKASAGGENHEWTTMYPEFAKVAREEGFEDIAKVLESIAVAEKQHEKALPGPGSEYRGGPRFQTRLADCMALPKLRLHARWRRSARSMSGLRTSAGIL